MARPTRAAVNANNLKQTPIPVVGSRLQLTNGDGTITRSGQLLLEQLQDVSGGGTGAAGAGPFIRTLILYDLTVGAAIAPFVPIYSPGPGIRAIGVLRKTITADLKIAINRNAETTPLFTFTLPHSTPIHTDVVHDISSVTFKDLDVLIAGITASDSSQDADGVATLTIEWSPEETSGSSGGTGGSGGFTAGGDLAGSTTAQSVVGLSNVPLDASTVGAPTNGQVLTYDSASGSYKAETPASGFTPAGDLSGTSTSQKVIGLESIPLDAATVGAPTNGQVIQYNSASGKYKALTLPPGFTAGGDLSGSGTSQMVIGLEGIGLDVGTVGAPTNGQVITYDSASGKYKAVTPAGAAPIVIGFVINSGAAGTNVGPMLAAPAAGSITKCVVVTKASDGSTALAFLIKQNGTNIFTTNPSVSAGTGSGSVWTFIGLTSSPLVIAAGDVFSIDITSGTGSWQFTAQLE